MDRLIDGVIQFMEEDFLEHKELFESLANSQTPHTLFIGCADSRVVPNLITNTLPGELFVVRNIANIVPHYRVSEEFLATTSAIEYALYSLNIKNIVVCGHSNCGGCEALYYEKEKLEKLPNVKRWLDLIANVKEEVLKKPNLLPAKRSWLTERLNIVNSVNNLLTFPHILESFEKGEIKIYGWHYIIETGELFTYEPDTGRFHLITDKKEQDEVYNQLFSSN